MPPRAGGVVLWFVAMTFHHPDTDKAGPKVVAALTLWEAGELDAAVELLGEVDHTFGFFLVIGLYLGAARQLTELAGGTVPDMLKALGLAFATESSAVEG